MKVNDLLAQYSAQISTGRVSQAIPIKNDSGIETKKESFASVLENELTSTEKLKFSKHAQERMTQRNMQLTPLQTEKLDEATKKAAEKGVKDTLVLMDNMAFIINVPSNVVITAMKDKDIEGNVFTQIDGAVIV